MKLRLITACVAMSLCAASVRAEVPNQLAWQGVVLDSLDQPITDGSYTLHFAVFNADAGGDSLWGESQSVTVQDGIVNVLLGSVVPLPNTLFDDSLRYLQVQFEDEAPYSPRVRLVSVGFAHRVQSVHGAQGGTISGDVNLDEDLTVAGDITAGNKATIGPNNTNTGLRAFVAGQDNVASGSFATISGGYRNEASNSNAVIGGGIDNTASGTQSVIGGGIDNTASGWGSTVPGGAYNVAQGDYSLAAGRQAKANHPGSFVWADTQSTSLQTTGPDQFLIRARGGVGIGTDAPTEALEVAGTIYSTAGGIKFPDGSVQSTATTSMPSGWTDTGSFVYLEATDDSVGIGTTMPTEKLDVDGNIKTSGIVRVGRFLELDGDSSRISSLTGAIGFGDADLETTGRAVIGPDNTLGGTGTFVAGMNNSAVHQNSTISGGRWNDADAGWTTICGGYNNAAMGEGASIGGGATNVAAGMFSTVPGGHLNIAMGDFSLAAGFRARADHRGTFVWADSSENEFFISTAPNQFLLRAQGGVGIGTDSPTTALEVAGTIYSSTGGVKFPDGSVQTTASTAPITGWTAVGTVVHLKVANDSVGIGTDTPTEKLDVAGNIKASGTIQAGNSILIDGTTGEITSSTGTIDFDNEHLLTTGKATLGPNNTNTALGSFVAGQDNAATGSHATISGGQGHTASSNGTTIGGGGTNTASAAMATVGGGVQNTASCVGSTVPGGSFNTAGGDYSFAAGIRARADHAGSFVWADTQIAYFITTAPNQYLIRAEGGVGIGTNNPTAELDIAGDIKASGKATFGSGNTNTGAGTFVAGMDNSATNQNATISGGQGNAAGASYSSVGGGLNNSATGSQSTVGGGRQNTASGVRSAVAGGYLNTASGAYSTTAGGQNNMATGSYATVPGGFSNRAAGNFSFAAGSRAQANHSGSFVWADSIGLTFASSAPNQFLIRADGGVGIGTNAPEGQLHVDEGAIFNDWSHGPDITPGLEVENLHDGHSSTLGSGYWGMAATAASNASWFKVGVMGQAVGSSGFKYGVYGVANGLGTNYAVYGTAWPTGYAGYFDGNVNVTGSLSKGSGSFKIDHPLDPENKYLYHSFVESPDMMNVYNGNIRLDASGSAAVELPEYFESLNREFRYQLTAIGQAAPNLHVASRIDGNRFGIAGGAPGMEVSWQVTGVRKDAYAEANRILVEEVKPASERGRYLHPLAHGKTRDRGIHKGGEQPVRLTDEQEVR